jgi:hypothetical protein
LLLHYTIVLCYSIAQIDTSPPPSSFFQVLGLGARGLGCWNYEATSLEEAWRQQAPMEVVSFFSFWIFFFNFFLLVLFPNSFLNFFWIILQLI